MKVLDWNEEPTAEGNARRRNVEGITPTLLQSYEKKIN